MTDGNGVINYNFAGLDTLSGDLNGQFKQLSELAEQLKAQVNTLGATWRESEGAHAYQVAQAKFDTAFEEAREQLHGLGRGVGHAAERMQQADRQVSNGFRV